MSITPESVKQLLSSEDYGDRIRGINQLRQLDKAIAFELVQPVVADNNTRVRYAAVSLLDTVGKQDLQKSADILRDRLLNDPEPDVQAAAADVIGALKLTEAFENLQNLYHSSPEWLVQFSIVAALGEMGDSRAFELLESALTSDNSLIQTAAISSLGELRDRRAVSLLSPFATHSDWQLRYRLVQALNRIGGEEAQAILQNLTKDEVEQVSKEAKDCLQLI